VYFCFIYITVYKFRINLRSSTRPFTEFYCTFQVRLKRTFSFSYVRENFAKSFFSLFAKKLTKSCKNFSEKFRENFRLRESFCDNFPFGMRILIQEPTECVSRSETWAKKFRENENFPRKFLEN
jgi:hypothetical protein